MRRNKELLENAFRLAVAKHTKKTCFKTLAKDQSGNYYCFRLRTNPVFDMAIFDTRNLKHPNPNTLMVRFLFSNKYKKDTIPFILKELQNRNLTLNDWENHE